MKKQKNKRISSDALASQSSLVGPIDGEIINPFKDIYNIIESYSLLFPDFAQAVANLQFTANCQPRVDIEFLPQTKGDKQKQDIVVRTGYIVSDFWARVYSSGVNGFVIDTIGQIARKGALSVEAVLDKRVSRVNELVHVPVRDIKFRTRKDGSHYPCQIVRTALAFEARKPGMVSEINLDIPTYFYMPIETLEGSPYGVPPFISVLSRLGTQNNIMENLDNISKKLGIMGFLQVLIDAPEKREGEEDQSYIQRVQTYLKDTAEKFTANFSRGVAVGLRDQMDVEYKAVSSEASGVAQIMQIVEEQIASGFKQDPAMFGRTYSTTETYAGVVYDKFINTLQHYTALVSSLLREVLMMELQFNGIRVASVRPVFPPPKSLTAEIDAKAESIKTTTVLSKRDSGIIDQAQAAKELGYDHPASPEPLYMGETAKERNRVDNDSAHKKERGSNKEKLTMSIYFESGTVTWRTNEEDQ